MKKYSLWLIPDKDSSKYLQSIINSFDQKTFIPHITILGGITGEEENMRNVLNGVSFDAGQIRLQLEGVSFSTTVWQDIFIRVKPTAVLLKLNMTLKEKYSSPNDFYVPHISLSYSNRPIEERESLASKTKVEIDNIMIEKIALVEVGEDVSKFRIVHERTS